MVATATAARPEAQQLFLHICGDRGVVGLLYVMAVDSKCRQALLGVGCQHGGQVDRAGALGAVKPHIALDGTGVHVHGLRAVAPAGRHRQGDVHTGFFEFVGQAAASATRPMVVSAMTTLDRLAVGIPQVFL